MTTQQTTNGDDFEADHLHIEPAADARPRYTVAQQYVRLLSALITPGCNCATCADRREQIARYSVAD